MSKQRVRVVRFPGSAQEFRGQMEGVRNRFDGHWESSDGEWSLVFGEQGDDERRGLAPETRTTWIVYSSATTGKKGHAAIEAYQEAGGKITRLEFWDGYYPAGVWGPAQDRKPIGPAFEEFCQMVIREAPQATPADRQTRGSGLAATWKLLIPFDILDAAVNRDLHGYAPGFVEFERREDTHGSVVYRMWQEDLGDLGTLTVRKAGDRTSVLEVSNPPHPQHRDPTPEEMAEIHAITGQREQDRAWGTLMTGIWQETDDLYQRRKKHQQDVRKALFSRMAHDPALAEWWPKVIGAESPTPTEDGAARLESASSINDILRRIDEMHLNLGGKLNDLKRGQVLIYQHIDAEDQGALRAIRKEIRQQRIEQGEMQNALDAIRRVLKHIHEAGLPVADDAIKQSLADIYQTVNSDIGLRQQLELSLPVIPFLLEYKIGLDERVDLGAVWKKLKAYSERSKRAIG